MARLLGTVLFALSLGCRQAPVAPPTAARELPAEAAPAAASGRPEGQLARVRPPPEPCGPHDAPAGALVERAAEHAAGGDHARSLACAEEALRSDGRAVAALHRRAAALAALGREEEARLAYARALAVDPDDPEALLAAADHFVSRAGGRDALLAGLEYALRGARAAERRRDRDLAARLLLVAAIAENDLGRAREALARADAALAHRPRDPALHHERGVALYELVRFAEARAALERALALAPGDPWTLHQLALVAEHEGDDARAQALDAQARTRGPRGLRGVAVTRAELEAEVRRAVAALPAHERAALATVPLEIADVPAIEDLVAVDPPLSPAILGLFRGPPEDEPCEDPREQCRSIALYWKNLARYARDRAELAEQVRVTLLHELGHLHGESDDELRDRGLE